MIIFESKKNIGEFYIFHIIKNVSKRRFLEIMEITHNRFASNLLSRIYDCFFSEMIDLCEEYANYHNHEYDTFKLFLEKKYNLPKKVSENAVKKITAYRNSTLCLRKQHVMGDYNLEQFIISKDGAFNILKNVFGVDR